MNLKATLPVLAGAIAGAIVALVISGGGSSSSRTVTTTTVVSASSGGSAPVQSVPSSLGRGSGMSVNQIYRSDSPGVVDIDVTSEQQSGGLGLFGGGGTQQEEGEGAGVVYDKQGDILTDQHVIAHATSVTVNFQNGVSAKAKVLGQDPSTDVGVIHVNVPASELHPISFANSSDAQVGDSVVAIGSPFSLPETTTAGIVSAVGRSIMAPNNFTILDAIQTDAAINPGNSGGPLLDAAGDVLGLNDQIQTSSGDSAGVGFATPANADLQIARAIISGHPIKHSYVGVCLQPSSSGQAEIARTASSNCPNPVEPGSPAANAGLKAGDLITAIDGRKVSSEDNFISVVSGYSPGTKVTFSITRNGSQQKISVTLGTRPASASTG